MDDLTPHDPAATSDRRRFLRIGGGGLLAAAVLAACSDDEPEASAEVATVSLGRLKTEDYDSPRSPLPSLRFHFDAPEAPGALLRQLGAPNGWSDARTPAERLGPIVHAAAETARRLALAQPADETEEQQSLAPTAQRRHRR